MSEIAANYHLRSDDQQLAVDMLKNSGVKGFVLKPRDGWVTVLAEAPSLDIEQFNRQLVAANQGVMLYYWCSDDFGWGFTLFEQQQSVCRYACQLEEDPQVDDAEFDLSRVTQLLPTTEQSTDSLRKALYPDLEGGMFGGSELGGQFARELGLSNFAWLSFESVEQETSQSGRPAIGGMVGVNVDATLAAAIASGDRPTSVSKPSAKTPLSTDESQSDSFDPELMGRRWIFESNTYDASKDSDFGTCVTTCFFDPVKKTYEQESDVLFSSPCRVDVTTDPKQIDMDPVQIGIYKIEGKRLWWCYTNTPAPRPVDFISRSGDGKIVEVWRLADEG